MIDGNELMEHLKKKKRTKFNKSLQKAKRKLQGLLEYHPEMTNLVEIRRYFKRNGGVKLSKITFKKLLVVTLWIGNLLRGHLKQLCTITKVSLTLKNLHI